MDKVPKQIYADYNATTPVDDSVIDAMVPVMRAQFGNPASGQHGYGTEADRLVKESREQVSALVGMSSSDVIFTSGATESNNMALKGLVAGSESKPIILAGATEHKSVLAAADALSNAGLADVKTIPVNSDGIIILSNLEKMLVDAQNVLLVTVMAANSETGVINPVKEAATLAHKNGALFHCDATQAVGRIPFDMNDLGIDMASFSAHKMYGPKGCGALVATRTARRRLRAIIHGGGQESEVRSGTLNVPGIVGFGKACEIASEMLGEDPSRQAALRDRLESRLMAAIDGITVNGGSAERICNTLNLRISGEATADMIMVNAPTLAVSSGSACSSSVIEPSHVLVAMGLSRDEAEASFRVSIGRQTTEKEIDGIAEAIIAAAGRVRTVNERGAQIPAN